MRRALRRVVFRMAREQRNVPAQNGRSARRNKLGYRGAYRNSTPSQKSAAAWRRERRGDACDCAGGEADGLARSLASTVRGFGGPPQVRKKKKLGGGPSPPFTTRKPL